MFSDIESSCYLSTDRAIGADEGAEQELEAQKADFAESACSLPSHSTSASPSFTISDSSLLCSSSLSFEEDKETCPSPPAASRPAVSFRSLQSSSTSTTPDP